MLKLIFFNLKTTFFRLFEWGKVVALYYVRNRSFLWIDGLLAMHYLLKNPHHISRDFHKKRGEKNIYVYGETPLTTLDHIAKECRILSKDVFYELGCGSGRTCLWLHKFVQCRVVGIEYLPEFVKKAERIKRWMHLSKVNFLLEDMLTADLQQATVIYLYGTCLEDEIIKQLVSRFHELGSGTKIITVSYPLPEYSIHFKLIKEFSGRFPWGKATIFLNEKI